jgi:hypothetical protein
LLAALERSQPPSDIAAHSVLARSWVNHKATADCVWGGKLTHDHTVARCRNSRVIQAKLRVGTACGFEEFSLQ